MVFFAAKDTALAGSCPEAPSPTLAHPARLKIVITVETKIENLFMLLFTLPLERACRGNLRVLLMKKCGVSRLCGLQQAGTLRRNESRLVSDPQLICCLPEQTPRKRKEF